MTIVAPDIARPIEPALRPLRRLYRRYRPIPKSANPKGDDEILATNLVPLAPLRRKFAQALRFLIARTERVTGDYLEFGIFNGASMTCMNNALHDEGAVGPRLIGFDSFKGLPPHVVHEDGGVWRAGQFECPKHLTLQRMEKEGLPTERVHFVEGWFADTLNDATIEKYQLREASIVMIDCDAYSSAKLALQFIAPLIRSYTFIFFDDWRLNDLDLVQEGEYRAFHEFRDAHPTIRWRDFGAYNRKSKVLLATRSPTPASDPIEITHDDAELR